MKIYRKAILPSGFTAAGISCGIKRTNKLDLAFFYSQIPAKAAAQFTTNKILAAPIKINKQYLRNNREFRGVVVNSGNANCFVGDVGLEDARGITKSLARLLKLKKEIILIASTGIIGRRLPILKIKQALPALVRGLSRHGMERAKKAIMTTDKFSKEFTIKSNIGNRTVTVCGIAKGAGMIAPNMATMLCFIFTDAHITEEALRRALAISVDNSFNCITVDGCMSTNDTIIVLANGVADNPLIDINPIAPNANFNSFVKLLNRVCLELAKLIVIDAEGATKFIQIKVNKAENFKEARKVALVIANSNLFKTAMYGENPNFGRIVAAVGASMIDIKERFLKIKVSSLNKSKIYVDVSLKRGNAQATVYTSDLTPRYIKINAEYN